MNPAVERVKNHRCFTHPIFAHWAEVDPAPEVVGALFHQIQKFCASTRPGHNFPAGLKALSRDKESRLMQEIVESEANHGPQLATMAGFIVNRRANRVVIDDLLDQAGVEAQLKEMSDRLLGTLPGYDAETGLTVQAREAIAVFERRKATDKASTYRNLGAALALEMVSNNQLIPGEKQCLVDSGLYGVSMDDPEMHYLLEHWGEIGAEQQHEKNAIAVIGSMLDEESRTLIHEGIDGFLDSLASLWDLLDSSLLSSGYVKASPAALTAQHEGEGARAAARM
jgi:hypothetical protein